VTESVRALFESLFDYAGLFPPAGLEMRAAVRNYAHYRSGGHSWMLSRFVVPAARLEEFEIASADFLPPAAPAPLWQLSVLSGADIGDTLGVAIDFNRRFAGRALIDTIELKAATEAEIIAAERVVERHMTPVVEIAMQGEFRRRLERIRACGARAKIRTGGSAPEAQPPAGDLASFVRECCAMKLPFKATAGLHHAVRSTRSGMHGFLNLLFASGLANCGAPRETVAAVLAEQQANAFRLGGDAAAWREHLLAIPQLRDARRLFTAVGTCSFEDPIADLSAMGAL
jgi:hypothetical protein